MDVLAAGRGGGRWKDGSVSKVLVHTMRTWVQKSSIHILKSWHDGGILGLVGRDRSVPGFNDNQVSQSVRSFRFIERLPQKLDGEEQKKILNVDLWPPVAHTQAHMVICTHKHTHK